MADGKQDFTKCKQTELLLFRHPNKPIELKLKIGGNK